ncbi:MAG: PAS domain-containing protein [Planctomycetota bacterium]|jgi:PAS domain S-box-containing protein
MVAERKRIEQMLRHLGMVTERTDVGIIVIDLKGIVHFVNTAWAKMHGYRTSSELLGKPMDAFHTKEQMENTVIPSIEETKHKGEFIGTVERFRRDGTTFPTRTKMAVLKDHRNKASGIMAFVTDITENKQLEERLKKTTQEVEKLKEQIWRLQDQSTEHKQAERELQEYCDQLEQRTEELLAQLRATCKQVGHKTGKRVHAEKISAENTEQEEPRGLGLPFDPQKLKALADMAKRLR